MYSGGGGGIRTCDQGLMSPCWHGRRRSPPSDFSRRDAKKAEKRTVANEGDRGRLSGRWMLSGCTLCGGAARGACPRAPSRGGLLDLNTPRSPHSRRQLMLTPTTVWNHVSNTLCKPQVADRMEAMMRVWAPGEGREKLGLQREATRARAPALPPSSVSVPFGSRLAARPSLPYGHAPGSSNWPAPSDYSRSPSLRS